MWATPLALSLAGSRPADGVVEALSKYVEQKRRETSDCEAKIAQARQVAEKLDEDIKLARREKELALENQQKEAEQLRARVTAASQLS